MTNDCGKFQPPAVPRILKRSPAVTAVLSNGDRSGSPPARTRSLKARHVSTQRACGALAATVTAIWRRISSRLQLDPRMDQTLRLVTFPPCEMRA
jgi:hypothetical protein